jgi:hypothetical protein
MLRLQLHHQQQQQQQQQELGTDGGRVVVEDLARVSYLQRSWLIQMGRWIMSSCKQQQQRRRRLQQLQQRMGVLRQLVTASR